MQALIGLGILLVVFLAVAGIVAYAAVLPDIIRENREERARARARRERTRAGICAAWCLASIGKGRCRCGAEKYRRERA